MGLGKTYSTKYLLDSNNNRGAVGQVLSTTSTGIDWVNANTVPGAGLWIESGNNIYNSNSDNVGIGVTNPTQKLHVAGSLELGPDFFIGSNSGNYWQRIRTVDDTADTTNAFNFETRNGSGAFINHMTILNSGNVGIGTSSPTTRLNTMVTANTDKMVLGAASGGFKVGNTTGNEYGINMGVSNSGASWIQVGRTDGTATAYNLNLQSAGGNVGIGTISPIQKLDTPNIIIGGSTIAGTYRANATLMDNLSGVARFYALGSDTSTAGGYQFNCLSSDATTGPGTVMTILNNGLVGIGTTNPSHKLEVNGGDAKIINGSTGILYLQKSSNFLYGDTNGVVIAAADYNFRIRTNSVDRLLVLQNGNVGIGTTFPSFQLSIENHATTTSTATLEIDGKRTNGTDGPVGELIFSNDGDTFATVAGVRDGADNKGSLQFQTQDSTFATRMTISSEGNVGIGTTIPDKTLTVGGTNTTHGINIKTKVGSTVYKIWEAEQFFSQEGYQGMYNDNVKKIQFRANGDSYFAGGDVGIGVTGPTQKLHVGGGLRVTGAYYDSSNDPGTPGQVLSSYASGTNWINAGLPITGGTLTGTLNINTSGGDRNFFVNPTATTFGIGDLDGVVADAAISGDGTNIKIAGVSEYLDNFAAINAGLSSGEIYRTGDLLKIVH